MSLKTDTLSGIKWTSTSAIVMAALLFFQQIILAYFLTKGEYGSMAILLVIIGFVNIFIDMGVSNAIIYKQDITHSQLSSLYWVNVFTGILFFIIISLASPFIVMFYSKVQIQPLHIIIISISFLITAFARQFRVILQKELLFKTISIIEIIAISISFGICIFMAWYGYGIYSIVIATVVNSLVQALLLIYKGMQIHKPALTFNRKEIKELLNFGRFQMGEKIINYFNQQLDVLLIGKIFGDSTLGVYSIAKTLVMAPIQLINPIITKVTFPVMSKVQDNDIVLKGIFLKTLNYLSSINFPIYTSLFILSQPVIFIIYGTKWADAAIILQLLSIAFLIRSYGNPAGSLLLAKGKANIGFYWNLALLLVNPLFVYIGSFWGLNGICISLIAMFIVLYFPAYIFLIKPLIPVNFMEYSINFIKPLTLSLIAGILSFFWVYVVTDVYLKAAFVLATGGIAYAFLNYFFNKNFLKEIKAMGKI